MVQSGYADKRTSAIGFIQVRMTAAIFIDILDNNHLPETPLITVED